MGTAADAPANFGVVAEESFARQDEIIAFEEGLFGPYPFENWQVACWTRVVPVRARGPDAARLRDRVLQRPERAQRLRRRPQAAHQWVGDSLAVEDWSQIWLNEGFATYTE